ncbi:MAG: hypothetical protein V7849_06305, partial [Candidatus Competibacter sp.]
CKIEFDFSFATIMGNLLILNHHQLEAGGLIIGGLNRRLEEKAAGSRWFAPRAERPSGGLKPPTDYQTPKASDRAARRSERCQPCGNTISVWVLYRLA